MTSKCQSEKPGLTHGDSGLSAQSAEGSVGMDDSSSTAVNSPDKDGGIEWQNYPIEGKVRAIGKGSLPQAPPS